MKTTRILLLSATLLLFPWCAAQLFAQQEGSKTITITKRILEADGTENLETVVKKGKAAELFDVEKYIRENRADNVQLEIKVSGGDEERSVVVKGSKTLRQNEDEEENQAIAEDNGEEGNIFQGIGEMFSWDDNGVFLGVDEDSDEKANEPGLVVNVVRGSAADKAGLHSNDKILKLNDTPTNKWSDLSKFIQSAKVGDKVRISYERNGRPATTEATLTRRNEVKCDADNEPTGFLGVSDDERSSQKEKPGVAVRITKDGAAAKAGLQNGDVIFQLNDTPISDFEDISDFMAYTKPDEKVSLTYERGGKRNTVEVTLGEEENSWNINPENWDLGNWDPEEAWNKAGLNNGKVTVNVNAKDACLGVFSDAYAEGNAVGSRINDFTEESAAKEVNLQKGDVITAVNGQAVKGHEDLWNEIAKFKVGDKIKIDYLRDGQSMSAEATLKACQDNSSKVQVYDNDGQELRNFRSWNWNENDQRNLRERSIITIRKGEGDGAVVPTAPPSSAPDRSLKLTEFRVFPNPTQNQLTVEFKGEPVSTTVSFFDLSGRQLFREELNAFNGRYSQQFDLSDYAKGAIVLRIQQGDKVYTEQVVVN